MEERVVKGDGTMLWGAEVGGLGIKVLEEAGVAFETAKDAPECVLRQWGPS